MNTVRILLIAALVVLLIGRRFTGRVLDPRRSMIVPAAMAVYGFTLVRHSPSISRTDVVWLVASGAAAVAAGADRSPMTSSTLLMFGVSLAAEAAIVLPRAFSSGVPIASRT
jgi:hypothetical protein